MSSVRITHIKASTYTLGKLTPQSQPEKSQKLGDGSVGEDNSCTSVKTWVWILKLHVKSQ